MHCEPNSIQCSIAELGRTLTSFNPNDLLATALATLVGVLVGSGLAFLISRGEAAHARELRDEEREDRRRERLNAALENLIWQINEHALALLGERSRSDIPGREWSAPDFGVLAAIAAARMIATNEDERAVLNEIRELTLAVRAAPIEKRIDSLTLVWRTLILWRERSSHDEVMRDLRQLRSTALDTTE
uniref:Uncharacterized protein n=1 Tax=Neobacillus citreus TaxID=2833578 RepID=A0A942T9M8_9BACI